MGSLVGEVESLVAALHSSLLSADRELQELGAEEEVLEEWHITQQGDHLNNCSCPCPFMIMSMKKSGQIESHFQSLVQKVEQAKEGVLAQLAKQVESVSLESLYSFFPDRSDAQSATRSSTATGHFLLSTSTRA